MTQRLEHDWFPEPLPQNVRLGERSWLYSSFAFVHCRSTRAVAVSIGQDSGVYAGSFFDLGENGSMAIGAFATVVGAVFATDGHVTVGDHAMLAHEVVLADGFAASPEAPGRGRGPRSDTRRALPRPCAAAGAANAVDDVRIAVGDNAWIGARAVLLAGARIGHDAIVGAAAVVDFEVPPFAIVAGNPARIVGTCAPRGAGASP